VATRLKNACRDYDYVARMGGDEFVLVLPGLDSVALQNRMLELERLTLKAGESICGERVVTLSVGHAVLGIHFADPESLLAEADRQMYRAKQRPRSSQLSTPDVITTEGSSLMVQ
jgi:diguanylate cyclase (GGDEF)-like protein